MIVIPQKSIHAEEVGKSFAQADAYKQATFLFSVACESRKWKGTWDDQCAAIAEEIKSSMSPKTAREIRRIVSTLYDHITCE